MIDLRSDTVSRPSKAMRLAMADAPVGDDVWGDDPSVNKLEQKAADLLGKDAALFVPSGTQSNLIALLTHCQRGDEYLVGQTAHTYRYEGGGAAVLGSIQPQPLPVSVDGSIPLEQIISAIKPDDFHFARTRLLCLENTISGKVLSQSYIEAACAIADDYKLKKHLDGARIFNAAIKLDIDVRCITAPFDSVSVCLSKGLGAPVGSILCGSEGFIKEGRRWRKMLGGGMRQAGIIAAAGIYALDNNIQRLAEDHANAAFIAQELSEIKGVSLDLSSVQTNMVFFTPPQGTAPKLLEYLEGCGILLDPGSTIRMVTHLDISRNDVLLTLKAIREFYSAQ